MVELKIFKKLEKRIMTKSKIIYKKNKKVPIKRKQVKFLSILLTLIET